MDFKGYPKLFKMEPKIDQKGAKKGAKVSQGTCGTGSNKYQFGYPWLMKKWDRFFIESH